MRPTRVFVNLTNHPVAKWSPEQVDAAKALGFDVVVDLPGGMPNVDPQASRGDIGDMATDIAARAIAHAAELGAVEDFLGDMCPSTDHIGFAIQGEATLSYRLARRADHEGVRAFAATTERKAVEVTNADGTVTKTSVFAFCQWRQY